MITMSDTNIDNVKAIADHLSDVPDSTIQLFIEDAKLELDKYSIPDKYQEKLQRYLTAHLATLNTRRVNSYSVDDISVSYKAISGEGLNSTEYGQEVKRILKDANKFFLKIL